MRTGCIYAVFYWRETAPLRLNQPMPPISIPCVSAPNDALGIDATEPSLPEILLYSNCNSRAAVFPLMQFFSSCDRKSRRSIVATGSVSPMSKQ